MPSPYPWHYTLRWPFYFRWPSTRNRTRIGRQPVARTLPEPGSPETLKLLFCGDIMVMQGDIIPSLHPDLSELISSADLFIGNCEAPVGLQKRDKHIHYRFNFHMPRECLQGIVQQTGLPPERWVLSIANNHSGDRGVRAFLDTESIMGGMGLTSVGRWRGDSMPVTIVRHQGVHLGIVSWTNWMNCEIFGADPGVFRTEHITGVDWSQVKKDEGLHTLIGLPHWEFEFQHFPHRQTRELARELIDTRGLDLIVGAHPHTLQPMEWFNRGLCAYSLGNFCGLGNAWSVKLISLLEVHLSMAAESKGKISSYRLHPFVQVHGDEKVSLVPLARAPEPIKTRIEQRLRMVFDVD